MAEIPKSVYEGVGLRAVRPYLIFSNADEAIDFYRRVFEASELERHTTPAGNRVMAVAATQPIVAVAKGRLARRPKGA